MPPSSDPPDARLPYLENLYRLAQVLSPDADAAAALVRAMPAVSPPASVPVEARKAWLFRELVRQAPPTDAPLGDLRRRLAARALEARLPAAFLALPREAQVLLTLCDVEGLAPGDAATVLDADDEAVTARLDAAHEALRDHLLAGATPAERRLLDDAPALPSLLRRTLKAELAAPPPTLRPALATPPEAAEAPVAPPPPAPVTAPPRAPGRRFSARRLAGIALLVVATGLLGYGLSSLAPRTPVDNNLITLSAGGADALQPSFHTGSPEQAERYVRSRLDWRVTVPTIEEARFLGVGFRTLAPDVEIPVFLYEDLIDGVPIAVHAYSYALLDRHPDRLRLARDVLLQIELDRHFDLHDLGRQQVLVWRHEDDIFVAVTTGAAETLRSRIQYPS